MSGTPPGLLPSVFAVVWRPDTARQDVGTLIAEWDLARAAIASVGLDDCFSHAEIGQVSLRTQLNHMIEEYARHIGHADLLRECIDGVTGD